MSSVSIILVKPLYSGNLGSVARAMKNFGLSQLLLVRPVAKVTDKEAQDMAVNAKDILKRAKIVSSLKEASEGFHTLMGTSRRLRRHHQNWLSPKQMAHHVSLLPRNEKLAIVFGNEKSGLSNCDLDLCHHIVHISTHPKLASLNLAAAVLLLAYELFSLQKSSEPMEAKMVKSETLNAMLADLEETLKGIRFFRGASPKTMMRPLRALFQRARTNDKEVRIVRGICRRIRLASK